MEERSFSPNGNALCLNGDPVYPHRVHLQGPFLRGPGTVSDEEACNLSMSRVRVSVEWVCGDIVNYIKVVDFRKQLKIGLSSVGEIYTVCSAKKCKDLFACKLNIKLF